MRTALSLLALLVFAPIAHAKLEISNIQLAHGVLGPERKSLECYPLDELVFRFVVNGVKLDGEGRTDLELAFKLMNSDGKAVIDQKGPIQRPLMLGGNTFSAHTTIGIGAGAPAGEYKLIVTIRDKQTSETATFERTLTCKPSQFQILAPRFYRDAESKVPAGTSGVAGESIYFRIKAVGYDRTQNKVSATMTMQVLNDRGEEMLTKPMVVNAELTRPEDVQKAMQLNFNGAVGLNRPGQYKLRIMVQDHISKQTATYETALKVEMP